MSKRSCMVRVTEKGYEPLDAWDWEVHSTLKAGEVVEIAPQRKRSRKQDAYWWALMKVVCDNTDNWPNPKILSREILVHLGYAVTYVDLAGREWHDPLSISDLDAEEMSVVIDNAKTLIEERIMPGVDIDALCREAWGK